MAHNQDVSRFHVFDWLVCVLLAILTGSAAAGQRQLKVEEVEHLARAALSAETKRLPGLSLERQKQLPRRAVIFDVLWSNPGPGSVHVQFLLVDLDTAEVWEPTVCRRVITSSLLAEQRLLRKRLKISISEVKRARTLAEQSGCSFE